MADDSFYIDNAPIREEVERRIERGEFSSIYILASHVGVDGTALARALGMVADNNRVGRYRQKMRYDTAVRVVLAMGMDPIDVGI